MKNFYLENTLEDSLFPHTTSGSVYTLNFIFCFCRPGRKLATVRKRVEFEILMECGTRNDIYSYYQSPLLNHYSSSLYPPLYTRNVEKEIGDTSLGYSQISLSSLWSILFKQTSSGMGLHKYVYAIPT